MTGHLDMGDGSQRSAFAGLAPVSPSYATMPIIDGFNWSECLEGIDAGEWYLVAFRSVLLREAVDDVRLWEQDDLALAEASRAPGFVHYFQGSVDERRGCLSFCIWQSRDQAQAAAQLPAHEEAIGLADEMYESYLLEYHTLRKRPGSAAFELESLGSRRVR